MTTSMRYFWRAVAWAFVAPPRAFWMIGAAVGLLSVYSGDARRPAWRNLLYAEGIVYAWYATTLIVLIPVLFARHRRRHTRVTVVDLGADGVATVTEVLDVVDFGKSHNGDGKHI